MYFIGQPLFYLAAFSKPCTWEFHRASSGTFLLPGLLLLFSQDTISGGEVLFTLPCEFTYEEHVYCISGLLTNWNCFLSGKNGGAQQSQLQPMYSPLSSGYKAKLATLKIFGDKKKLFQRNLCQKNSTEQSGLRGVTCKDDKQEIWMLLAFHSCEWQTLQISNGTLCHWILY